MKIDFQHGCKLYPQIGDKKHRLQMNADFLVTNEDNLFSHQRIESIIVNVISFQ
jgi:hypothetical protein